MASKVSDWSTNQSSNGEIGGVNIAEGCSPAGINNAIRTVMSQIATARTGSDDGLITGTAGTAGNVGVFDANGDLIDGGAVPGGVSDNAVTTVKIANGAVTRAKIADAAMSGDDATLITGTAGAAGVLAQWNADGDLVSSVSITDEAATIAANDTDTAIPTNAAVIDYLEGKIAPAALFSYQFSGTPVDFNVGSWAALPLNTTKKSGAAATLVTNSIRINQAGTYYFEADVVVRNDVSPRVTLATRIVNTTTGDEILGAGTSLIGDTSTTLSVCGELTISALDVVEFQGWANQVSAILGANTSAVTGSDNVSANLKIWKT